MQRGTRLQKPKQRENSNTATLAPVLSLVLASLFSAALPSTTVALRSFEVLPYPQLLWGLYFQSLSATLATPNFAALSYSALLYLHPPPTFLTNVVSATLRSASLATLPSGSVSCSQLICLFSFQLLSALPLTVILVTFYFTLSWSGCNLLCETRHTLFFFSTVSATLVPLTRALLVSTTLLAATL